MPLVTLIGEKIAKEGTEFIYLGPNNDCKNCKLKNVCFNLKIGRKYIVTQIREKRHTCSVHEANAAVVEVQEQPLIIVIDQSIKEGMTTQIEPIECKNIGCQNYDICNVNGIQKDKKYKITKIIEKIECPIGKKLNKAELTE